MIDLFIYSHNLITQKIDECWALPLIAFMQLFIINWKIGVQAPAV